MIEKSERDYDDLTAKKATVARDRSKIEAVISELEVKKQETLEATWQKVNRDFGSIFSSLLPGAHAKLEPPEGATSVLDGLEVKVGFGGLWKESLSELSGGQRSLIALSLVLAMLLFKPAPMYILDEVDAALDLSHTQNIGVMLCVEIKILRRVRAESSRRPPRHRRDACSMAWRCRILTARPSQDGRVIAEK